MTHIRQQIEIRCDLCDEADRYAWSEAASEVCWLTVEVGLDALSEHLSDVHGAGGDKLSLESDPMPNVPVAITTGDSGVGRITLTGQGDPRSA
jgi:hypothetical protein